MNPEPRILENPQTASEPLLETPPSATDKPVHRKIAQLPKALRDQINSMLDDSLPYAQIIEKLQQSTDPPLPYPISEMNLSRWKEKGYQRYLAQQEHLDYVRGNREAALDMVAGEDTTTLPEATLQIIASQYYDLLGDFSPNSLKQKLAEDPLKYTRLVSVFARLTREILHLKKDREACAKARAAIQNLRDPKRKLTESERRAIVLSVDNILGLSSEEDSDSAAPADPTPSGSHSLPSLAPPGAGQERVSA